MTTMIRQIICVLTLLLATGVLVQVPRQIAAQSVMDPASLISDQFKLFQEVQNARINNINIEITPQYPGPYEQIQIRIGSVVFDPNTATIEWTLDGKSQRKGVGERSFSFRTGGLGSRSVVTFRITSFEQRIEGLTQTLVFRPSQVDLLWESVGNTPPFYKGRPLYSAGAKLRATAIPHIVDDRGAIVDPRSLVYIWELNGEVQSSQSGFGRQSIEVPTLSSGRTPLVEVRIKAGASQIARAFSAVPVERAKLLFYEHDPLLGVVFDRIVEGTVAMREKELTFEAYPIFLPGASRIEPGAEYKWSVDGKPVAEPARPASLTLGVDRGSGTARVSLMVTRTRSPYHIASGDFRVTFNSNNLP